MAEITGPPAPRSKYDNIPAAPLRVPAEAETPSVLRDVLLPIVLAQGLDFLSTEKPLGFNQRSDMEETANKFPGARSKGLAGTAGRLGSNLSELLLAALVAKIAPEAAGAFVVPTASSHVDYAKRNWWLMDDMERRNRLRALLSRPGPAEPPPHDDRLLHPVDY